MTDLRAEQETLITTFAEMLRSATADGGRKRAAGIKPPWWRDPAHEPAIFSHLNKWKHGETRDKDSGAHPLVHLAWRALAIAHQETYGLVDPAVKGYAAMRGRMVSAALSEPDTSAGTAAAGQTH